MSFPRKKLHKLDDWRDFEELCTDILTKQHRLKWSSYGRIGQKQEGRDALYLKQNKRLIVAQFKNYTEPNAERLINDISKDVTSIINNGTVEKIIIMTSHDRDVKVMDAVIELRKKYNLTIEDRYWDDITKNIFRYKTLMKKYYPEVYMPTQMISKKSSSKAFENSNTRYQLLRDGRFSHLKFDETLLAGTKPLKPIDILLKDTNEKTETLIDTLKNHKGNFVFIGEGGTGKTTSLLRIWEEWLKEKKELPLYVPLNEYNIEKQKNFISSYLKDYYNNFDLSTTNNPVILLLDGFNEIYGENSSAVIQEIKKLVARHRTRIVITSRYNFLDIYPLEGFATYGIEPLSSERIEKFWTNVKTVNPHLDNVNLPDNYQKLLETPMMLTLFANTCAVKQKSVEESGLFRFKPFKTNMGPQTTSELIYNYLLCQLVKLADGTQQNALYSAYIALFWVAPYAAWRMENKKLFSEEKMIMRQDMADYLVKNETFIRSSADTFLAEAIERHIARCPNKSFTELLFNPSHPDTPSFIGLLVDVCHLLSTEDIRVEKTRYTFRHQHFRDFLSTLHIVNALDMALSTSGAFSIPNEIKDRELPPDIIDMLGGYYEDYQNQEKCNVRTPLHELLDRLRLDDSQAGHAVKNIIGVWSISRKDQIVGENLSKLNLTDVPLNNILFSTPTSVTCFNDSIISGITFLPQGHSTGIKHVVYSADGSCILTAAYDGAVREWNRKTGKCLRIFEGHKNGVNSAVYSADGSCILTAAMDGAVREWNRKTGKCLRTFEGHESGVNSAVYSADGSCILSASWDNTVREWDRKTEKCIRTFRGHENYVYNAVYSADGSCILTAAYDGTVREWNRKTGKCLRTFEGHESGVETAIYSTDGKRILSASDDKTIKEWNRKTGKCLRTFEGHESGVNSAVYSTNESYIVSSSRDGTVKEWDIQTEKCIRTFRGHKSHVYNAVYSVDEERILSASGDGVAKEWNRQKGECLLTFKGHASGVETAVYSADGSCILTASYDGSIREWDRQTGECLRAFKGHNTSFASWVVYSADACCILSASGDGTVREWDRKTGKCTHIFKGHNSFVYDTVYSAKKSRRLSSSTPSLSTNPYAVYSADGSCILSTAYNTVREWDRKTGKCLRTFEGHESGVNSAVYSADGSCILSASWDNTVREWDRKTEKCKRIFKGHVSGVYSAVYSPNGFCILSASGDGTVREWDRKTEKCTHIFKGHNTNVYSVVYSADGKRILSSSREGTVREWDRETETCIHIFKGHNSFVYSAVYSPNGLRILSASADGTVREWDRKTEKCVWATPPYGGVFIVGCNFKNCKCDDELKQLIRQYGGKI